MEKQKLNSESTRNIATVLYTSTGTELSSDNEDIVLPNKQLIIPSRLSLGFGIGQKKMVNRN